MRGVSGGLGGGGRMESWVPGGWRDWFCGRRGLPREEGELDDEPEEEDGERGDGDGDGDDGTLGSRAEPVLALSLLEADTEEEDGDAEELEWGVGVSDIVPGLWGRVLGRVVFVLAIMDLVVDVVSLGVFAAAVLALLPLLGECSGPRTEIPRFLLDADIEGCCAAIVPNRGSPSLG